MAVRWTEEELESICVETAKLRLKSPDSAFGTLVAQAQKVLPADRRRKINNSQTWAPILDRVRTILAAIPGQRTTTQPTEKIVEKIRDLTESELLEQVQRLDHKTVISIIGEEDVANHLPLAVILSEAGKRLAGIIDLFGNLAEEARNIREAIENLETTPTTSQIRTEQVPATIRAAVTKPAKVMVIGPKPNQQQHLIDQLKRVASINFIENGVRDIPSGTEVVVIWVKFTSHAMFQIAQDYCANSKAKLIVHRGGLGALAQKIYEEIRRL